MAKSHNQKAKILFLEQMLRETGENHVVTMQEILAKLMEYGIPAERKSIYDDIEALRSFGMDVKFRRGRPGGYYLSGNIPESVSKEEKVSKVQAKEENEGKDALKGSVNQEDIKKRTEFVRQEPSDKEKKMRLLCVRDKEEQVKAYFGGDAKYKEKEPGYFTVTAPLLQDSQFYGWLTAMGTDVHIIKPKKLAQSYRDYLKTLAKEYKQLT